jgi:hypothetical protein
LIFVISQCNVDAERLNRMNALLDDIQRRWGVAAIQPLSKFSSRTTLPGLMTGFPVLDVALGISGIPLGETTELMGRPLLG